MNTTSEARCPRCNRRTSTTSSANQHAFYCHHCKMEFEAVDDGDIGYRRPETNAANAEQRAARRRQQEATKR